MKFIKKEKGFTLIELLVVVSIIGVLASVVLSSLNDARQRARIAKTQSDLRQIYTLIETARIFENETLLQITGSNCTYCYGDTAWLTSIDAITIAADPSAIDGSRFYTDAWGNPFFLDENEGEQPTNPCREDILRSTGPDGIHNGGGNDDITIDIPFSTGRCL